VIVIVNQDSTVKSYTLKINGMKIKGINCTELLKPKTLYQYNKILNLIKRV